MLMALGPVVFDRVSNLTETSLEVGAAFAKHDVVGGDPVYEAMGGEGASFTLTGQIHPEHFGVNGALARLEAAEAAQTPLPLMRGDFVPVGWVVIEKLQRQDKTLGFHGVGREIDFTVSLIRVGRPGLSLARTILKLF